ncbi:MAG TPA: HDOD domain-containing protein [Gammaproteobacteria bacterium]
MPNDLNSWVELLGQKPLPLLATTRLLLKELMGQSQLSVTQYAGPVLQDPGLSVQLFNKANGDRKSSGRMPLTTINNTLSHLGQGQFQQQLEKAQVFDSLNLPDKNRQGYLRYVAQACHAAYQARDWGQLRKTLEPEEMQCAAIMQNIAELALWCYGGDAMIQIEHKCYGKKQDYDSAAQQVLGCDIRKLSAQLAEKWNLPELVSDALLSDGKGFTLATGVALSSRLARLVSMSWYDKVAMQCVQDIAQYKGKSPGEVETGLHNNAVALTEAFQKLGYVPPARLLPMLVDETFVDPQFIISTDAVNKPEKVQSVPVSKKTEAKPEAQKPAVANQVTEKVSASAVVAATKTAPVTKPNVATQQKPLATQAAKHAQKTVPEKPAGVAEKTVSNKSEANPALAQSISQLNKMIQQKTTVPQLIQQAVDTLKLMGFHRVVFAVNVSRLKMLVGRFVACDDNVKSLQDFKIALDRPSLFKLLLEKPNYLWINDSNRVKYWAMVPDNAKLILANDSFFVMSIFSGKQAIGLMYADKIKVPLTEDEFKKFVGLCRLLIKGISEVSAKPPAAADK